MLPSNGSPAALRFTLRIGFAVALSASVTGCTVGPKYHRPTVNLQPFHNAPSIETRVASMPSPPLDQWWTGFHDPALTRVVKRALDENLDLAAAMTRVEQARAAARGAGARRLPSAALSGSTTSIYQSTESMTGRIGRSLPGYDRSQNYYDLGISASWEADLFGGLKKGAEAATAEAQAAEALHTGTRITVAAEAADAYMQIRGAQARLIFAKEQISTDTHLVELVQQRKDAGIASDRELAQAQAVLSQAKATVPLIKVSLEAQLNRLDVLTGAQPGTYAAELTPVVDIPEVPAISDFGTPTDLLRRRPDIIAALMFSLSRPLRQSYVSIWRRTQSARITRTFTPSSNSAAHGRSSRRSITCMKGSSLSRRWRDSCRVGSPTPEIDPAYPRLVQQQSYP
ncbi:TolC family protein [Tunturiibacter gelidiferens]|uniref:NodT family efflux transporter outer membrane factor (OMF) lipoprotein n=1 Tax=Tunturiibacter lichenicola TaxID=2051959 RepID=A0A7Y9NQB8_9BACT|nr:TolC family protein [Edaphobacter lichenicola]NYF53611.1 NodT family efflux transporter outer membrane factor (OMF) lipoprotein [Edaphobacter lichenicola]